MPRRALRIGTVKTSTTYTYDDNGKVYDYNLGNKLKTLTHPVIKVFHI